MISEPVSFLSVIRGTSANAIDGLLGLLLLDESSNNVVALTARQLAAGHEGVSCAGTVVARSSADNDRSAVSRKRRPAWTMIEKLVLASTAELAAPTVELNDGELLQGFRSCAEPLRHAGNRVFVYSGSRGVRPATLRSVRGHFAMPLENGADLVTFYDALVLDSGDGEPISIQGDAGAIVATDRGEPLGIVICGIGATSFAAPVGPFFSTDDALRELRPDDVSRWNERRPKAASKINLSKMFEIWNQRMPIEARRDEDEAQDSAAEAEELAAEAL